MKIHIKLSTLLEVIWKFCIAAGLTHLLLGHLLFEVIMPTAWAAFCAKLNWDYSIWHLLILSIIIALFWQIFYEWYLYRKRKNETQRNILK